MVHFFSGPHRAGDVEDQLQSLAAATNNIEVWVEAIDLVRARDQNVLLDELFETFVLRARRGELQGAIGGPPCELWSPARHLGPEAAPRASALKVKGGLEGLTFAAALLHGLGERLVGLLHASARRRVRIWARRSWRVLTVPSFSEPRLLRP